MEYDGIKSEVRTTDRDSSGKEEIAGANIVVIRDGQEMAFAADGYADIEAGKKYERDTIARLYSMTKPVTSAAAMLLMERGLLDPGAFVEEFCRDFTMRSWHQAENLCRRSGR